MNNKVTYEWTKEEIDADGDIIDSYFYDRLQAIIPEDFRSNEIGLVRNEGNEVDGVVNRFWAYVRYDVLPDRFSDATGAPVNIKVPKKYHAELKKYLEKNK